MDTDKLPDPYHNSNGITVKELKDFLQNFPNDAEVWQATGDNRSSPVTQLWVLGASDIILEPSEEVWTQTNFN